MEKPKMPRIERAKQFASFDALKGLQNALRLKEYEHEKVAKGELTEERALEISTTLQSITSGDLVDIKYYHDEHNLLLTGTAYIDFENHIITIANQKISFDDLISIIKK